MRIISKYLWASLLLCCGTLAAAWWALSSSGSTLPASVLKKMGEHIEISAPSLSVPEIELPTLSNPLPQTRTYYRWTDKDGNTGYTQDLPADVSSFKTIVLSGDENILSPVNKP